MRSSRALAVALAMLLAGQAAAQSTLNVVVVPGGAGVVIPPRGAAPRMTARPPAAGPEATLRPSIPANSGNGTGGTPALGALILPGIAAALLAGGAAVAGGAFGGGNSASGVGRGGGSLATGPARTR